MNAKGFLMMAVRESDCPDTARGLIDLAEIEVMGGIGEVSGSRDEFIANGLRYLENFADTADTAKTVCAEKNREDLVEIIERWGREARNVSFAELFTLLAADWDERHED